MSTMAEPPLEQRAPLASPGLRLGAMVTTNLAAARKFYEEFLGLECVRFAPGKLLIRDPCARRAMKEGSERYFLLEVTEVQRITNEQRVLNHWGFDVGSRDEVDRIHAAAHAHKDLYGIRKIHSVRVQHGAYAFYFEDRDANWWEIEFRLDPTTTAEHFARGDEHPDI